MKKNKWFYLRTDFFNEPKTLLIKALPDGDGVIVIWLKLLCLACKQETIKYDLEALADAFDRPPVLIDRALNVFERFGMIDIDGDIITVKEDEQWQKEE